MKKSKLIQTIQEQCRRYYLDQLEKEPWYKRAFYAFITFFSLIYSEVIGQRVFVRVASATYTTMLAVIPFFIVGGSLILTFNKQASSETLISKINEFVIPVAGDTISQFLVESLTRTLDIGLGPVGLISLIVTSVMLFVHIEDCFNDLWHVDKPRAFYFRMLMFYAVVTLCPIFLSFSIYQSTQIIPNIGEGSIAWKIISETAILGILVSAVYKFLPNAHIRFKCAIIPGLIVGVLLETVKFAFGLYFKYGFSSNYNILYGAIGILPITLLWLYICWTIILFGVVIGYCMQNRRSLLLNKIYDTDRQNASPWIFLGNYAPIEIIACMVRELTRGKPALTADEIALSCIYPKQAVEAVLYRLEANQIIRKIDADTGATYTIAKPLDSIELVDIMNRFDESTPRVHRHPNLARLVEEIIMIQKEKWLDLNANALREEDELLEEDGKRVDETEEDRIKQMASTILQSKIFRSIGKNNNENEKDDKSNEHVLPSAQEKPSSHGGDTVVDQPAVSEPSPESEPPAIENESVHAGDSAVHDYNDDSQELRTILIESEKKETKAQCSEEEKAKTERTDSKTCRSKSRKRKKRKE